MDATFAKFIDTAKRLGLCQEYTDKVDKAGSKKAFVDIALDINGIKWMCESICRGWGLSPEYIAKEFAPFNNGKYTRDKDGYTAQMYCLPEDKEITISSTVTLIIGFDGVVKVDRLCELYIVSSNVVIVGNQIPQVYAYNSNVEHPDTPIVVRENKTY